MKTRKQQPVALNSRSAKSADTSSNQDDLLAHEHRSDHPEIIVSTGRRLISRFLVKIQQNSFELKLPRQLQFFGCFAVLASSLAFNNWNN
jgi:hypothetical protein